MAAALSASTPIELVSAKPEDNLLVPILGESYPFQVCAKYTIDTRFVQGQPCLLIDCTTRRVLKETCLFFLRAGFDLTGRYVVTEQEDGYRKLLGSVSAIKGETLHVTRPDGQIEQIEAKDAYLEASRANFDDYILHTHGAQKDAIVERIRQSVSSFNGGENKKTRIETLKKYVQSKTVSLIDGTRIEIEDAPDIQGQCEQMQKPVFVFNDNGEADWAEKGPDAVRSLYKANIRPERSVDLRDLRPARQGARGAVRPQTPEGDFLKQVFQQWP